MTVQTQVKKDLLQKVLASHDKLPKTLAAPGAEKKTVAKRGKSVVSTVSRRFR